MKRPRKRKNRSKPGASKPTPTQIRRLLIKAGELGLHRRGRTLALMKGLQNGPFDLAVYQYLLEMIREEEHLQSVQSDPLRPTTPWHANSFDGPLALGTIPQTGHGYGLIPTMLREHILLLGRAGGGKTTVMKAIILALNVHSPGTKVIILERKQEFTEVARMLGFNVITTRDLRINVLRPPPGIASHIWLQLLTQQMVNYLDIMTATATMIIEKALELFQLRGADDNGNYPNLFDLYNFIQSDKHPAVSHFARHRETAINRLSALLHMLPDVFVCDRGFDPEKMTQENTLFLLEDVPQFAIQNFLISEILSQLFLYRMVREGHRSGLQTVFVLDEATPFFRRVDETQNKPSYVADLVSRARAYGIGILAGSQYATDLSHSLLANTATKILVGGFERMQDTELFLNLRPHDTKQADFVKSQHTPGCAFIADPRHSHLIECRIAQPELAAPMTKAEVETLSKQCAERFGWNREQPTACVPDATEDNKPEEPKPVDRAPPRAPTLTLLQLLEDVESKPFEKLRDRTERLCIPRTKLKSLLDRLEQKNWAVAHHVHCSNGRPRDLFEITEEGYTQLKKKPPRQSGKGGFLHRFYQKHVAAFLKAEGYSVQIEGRADDKGIDLIAVLPDSSEFTAVEIELHAKSSRHFLDNIRKDLAAARITRIVCLAPKNDELKIIQKAVKADSDLADHGAQITFARIADYLGDLDET